VALQRTRIFRRLIIALAFSPDEKFLYIGNWDEKKKVIFRHPVNADGSLAKGELSST
jgi:hypothetical protein